MLTTLLILIILAAIALRPLPAGGIAATIFNLSAITLLAILATIAVLALTST